MFLATVQIGVTFSGFLSAALGIEKLGKELGKYLDNFIFLENNGYIISLLVITFTISILSIIFGELIPKQIAYTFSEKTALLLSGIIIFFIVLFKPVSYILVKLTSIILKILKINENKDIFFTKNEIIDIITNSSDLSSKESSIVRKVIEDKNQRVESIMVPRVLVDFLNVDMSLNEAKITVERSRHSRYPVYQSDEDEVIGYVHIFDLFSVNNSNKEIRDIIRDVFYVPNSKNILTVLDEMRVNGTQFAIVLDEFGGTDGIITLEDIIESIVGDISDEFDSKNEINLKNSNDFTIDGLSSVDDINNEYNISLPKGPYDTIGGLFMYKSGKIPQINDYIILDKYKLVILSMDSKRIDKIKLFIY